MNNLELLEKREYTYRELCELFGEERKSSDSKQAQLREWRRFFSWSNPTTHRYSIQDIYEKPLEKVDGRRSNGGNCTSKYIALDDLIMSYICTQNNYTGTISYFANAVGLLTSAYTDNRFQHNYFYEYGYEKVLVDNIFWKIDSILLNAIKAALQRLSAEGCIGLEMYVVLVDGDDCKRTLNLEETSVIKQFEEDVRSEMNISGKDLYRNVVKERYYHAVGDRINKHFNTKLKYYYQIYNIECQSKEYSNKANSNLKKISRLFVKEICCSIFRNPYNNYFLSNDENCIHTIHILNELFLTMNENEWYSYCDEGELEEEIASKDMAFFCKYCMVYYNYLFRKSKESEMQTEQQEIVKVDYRSMALEKLGQEDVEYAEKAIPNLNWEKALSESWEQKSYLDFCDKMLRKYEKEEEMQKYCKDEEESRRIIKKRMEMHAEDYRRQEYSWLDEI